MNIQDILRDSYHQSQKALVMGTSPQSLARARERAFVKSLAAQFEARYAAQNCRVFSVYGRGNRADFGSEQLLFDIEVCRAAAATSAHRHQQSFFVVTEALWQVAIDLSRDWRQVVYAMNRLRCGAAANKLVIAAAPKDAPDSFLKTLAQACPGDDGAFYLATMPHPRDWEEDDGRLELWQIAAGAWQSVTQAMT